MGCFIPQILPVIIPFIVSSNSSAPFIFNKLYNSHAVIDSDISTSLLMSISPVSIPVSISMVVFPVFISPFIKHQFIGADPLYIRRREACRQIQPSLGISSISLVNI